MAPFDIFFFSTIQTGAFICVHVVIDGKQDGYVAHMWEMFRQGSPLSVYSSTLSGHSDSNSHLQNKPTNYPLRGENITENNRFVTHSRHYQ